MSKFLYLVLFGIIARFASASTPVYLTPYLQSNDDVDSDTFMNPVAGSNICARNCLADDTPKICYYQWNVENYVTLGKACGNCPSNTTDCYKRECIPADGFERGLLSVNRKLPGPSIEVCLGDRVIVDVANKIAGRTTAIHWHGVFQQGSQYMDGVPMLTQCSIIEGNTFRYDFIANNEGTHFWHSHDGLQKLDGLEGNLVIRTPQEYDANGALYDYDLPEHKIMIQDWMDDTADNHFPGLLGPNKGQNPKAFLINGFGNTLVDNTRTGNPYTTITVENGMRYRMRIIGGLCTTCPVEFSIQNHTMMVIAADGNSVNPTRVTSIVLFSGERYDIVLDADQLESAYWIHVKGLSTCVAPQIYQLGVLLYNASTNSVPPTADPGYEGFQVSPERIMNPENGTCGPGTSGICTTMLVNPSPVPNYILNRPADFNFLLNYGNEVFDPDTFFNYYERYYVIEGRTLMSHTMNNISFVAPSVPPLSQHEDLPPEALCPAGANGLPACSGGASYCECTQVIKVPLGSVVQILLNDQNPGNDINHPFHLHGYAFYVMRQGQFTGGLTVQDVYQNMTSNILAQSSAPVQKDTIAVPSNGFAIIKFRADNPGFWIFHCHFMYHLATGMGLVFEVGETADFPPVPAGFPKCGNFLPQVYNNN